MIEYSGGHKFQTRVFDLDSNTLTPFVKATRHGATAVKRIGVARDGRHEVMQWFENDRQERCFFLIEEDERNLTMLDAFEYVRLDILPEGQLHGEFLGTFLRQ